MNTDQQKKYNNAPIIESFVKRTKTEKGEFVIHRTVITDIKPVLYYEKVLAGRDEEVGA